MPADLFAVSVLRALTEVTGWIMIGQGVLFVIAGRSRHENFVYQMFLIVTRPLTRFTRAITPRFVRDDHIPVAAFMLLLWIWLGLGFLKRYLCTAHGVTCV